MRDIRLAAVIAVAVFLAFGAWRVLDSTSASKGNADAAAKAECLKLLRLPLGSPQYDHERFVKLHCASR